MNYLSKNSFKKYLIKGLCNPTKLFERICEFYYIFGERSNGKTTVVLGYLLGEYIDSGFSRQFAIIRRYDEDIIGSNCMQLFKNIIKYDYINLMTKGTFNGIYYYNKKFYLTLYDENGKRINTDKQPFAYVFSISSQQRVKSTAYENIHSAFFDEVASKTYLKNEFVEFMNLISTLVRNDGDFKVIMCSNTISRYCLYYREMGLVNISKQKQGTIDFYEYTDGESSGIVGCYYCEETDKKIKESNKFFAFNNPKLKMITKGVWEIDNYPHLPYDYMKNEVIYTYYIVFEDEKFECEIIYKKNEEVLFTYIHEKTTPIKKEDRIIFNLDDFSPLPNHRRFINNVYDKIGEKILSFYTRDLVYYQNNFVGDSINNYLRRCIKK